VIFEGSGDILAPCKEIEALLHYFEKGECPGCRAKGFKEVLESIRKPGDTSEVVGRSPDVPRVLQASRDLGAYTAKGPVIVWRRQGHGENHILYSYLIQHPTAHAFWSYWVMYVMHLRPMSDLKDAEKTHPDNTHEITIMALNPDKYQGDPDPTQEFYPVLTPIDVCCQFHVDSDADAVRIADHCIKAMLALSPGATPDSDSQKVWERAITRIAAGMRSGEYKAQ
jgi:hypothetical protein